jgi:hypothetical protein
MVRQPPNVGEAPGCIHILFLRLDGYQRKTLLEIENLKLHFLTRAGAAKAVDGVSFTIEKNEKNHCYRCGGPGQHDCQTDE